VVKQHGASVVRVPSSLDEISAEWLTEALREGGLDDVVVASVHQESLGAVHGFACVLSRLVIEYATAPAGAPASLVAKIPNPDPVAQAAGSAMLGWERESRFYADLAPRIAARTARCFYNGAVPERVAFLLLLEDLGGLTTGDQIVGLTPRQAEVAARWLGEFHSSWCGRSELADFDWLEPMHERRRQHQPLVAASWEPFVEKFGPMLPAGPLGWMEKYIDTFGQPRGGAAPTTVVHGDFRPDNFMLDGDRAIVPIDWQNVAITTGAYDLANLVATAITPEQRRLTTEQLVETYRKTLLSRGVDPGTYEELFESVREEVLNVMAVLTVGAVFTTDPRSFELVRVNAERAYVAALDLDLGEFV
jgi:hypothetical protein